MGGGGGRGLHRNDFSPITFIVHNQKSNRGLGHGVNWGAMPRPPPPPPIVAAHRLLKTKKKIPSDSPWTMDSEGRPNQLYFWGSFWLGHPGPAGTLDIVHPLITPLLIRLCSFYLSCPIALLEKDNFIEDFYLVLSY